MDSQSIKDQLEYFRLNGIIPGETHDVVPVPLEDLTQFAKRSCNRCHGKGYQMFTPAEDLVTYQRTKDTAYAAGEYEEIEAPVAQPHSCGCIFKRLPDHVGSYGGGLYYFFEFVTKDGEKDNAKANEG